MVGLLVVVPALLGAKPKSASSQATDVAWGRIVTDSRSWSVHQGNDPQLVRFIREQTTLGIDPTCYPVNPQKLEDLSRYPFLFTNNLTDVRREESLANLREYLRRGGFIYIDRCVNLDYSLQQELFYGRHVAFFRQLLPSCTVRELKRDHDIFGCYFSIADRLRDRRGVGHDGIYGVYAEGRMVALLSLANYQCGWPQARDHGAEQMKMIANIYVYATLGEPEPAAMKPVAP